MGCKTPGMRHRGAVWVARAAVVMMAACMAPAGDCFVAPTCQAPAGHAPRTCVPVKRSASWRLGPAAPRGACQARTWPKPCTTLSALSTPVAEQSSSEGNFSELARLLDTHEAEITVREAAGMEGDCVAKMRCSVIGQGKDMYRSQRQKMRTSPHYLLAGIYKTTLMVAVVRALTPKARQVCKDVVLADMQQLLDQAWLSEREHAQLVEQFEHEWKERSELVIGSVDCSVHEMLDSSLTLRRWVCVSSMAVRNHLRRRGIGELLLELAVTHARKIFGVKDMFLHVEVGLRDAVALLALPGCLEVQQGDSSSDSPQELNEGALRLYRRAGFVPGDVDDSHTKSMDRFCRPPHFTNSLRCLPCTSAWLAGMPHTRDWRGTEGRRVVQDAEASASGAA